LVIFIIIAEMYMPFLVFFDRFGFVLFRVFKIQYARVHI